MVSTKVGGRGNCAVQQSRSTFYPHFCYRARSVKLSEDYFEKKNKSSVGLVLNFFLKLNFQRSFLKCTLYYIFNIFNHFQILLRDTTSNVSLVNALAHQSPHNTEERAENRRTCSKFQVSVLPALNVYKFVL